MSTAHSQRTTVNLRMLRMVITGIRDVGYWSSSGVTVYPDGDDPPQYSLEAAAYMAIAPSNLSWGPSGEMVLKKGTPPPHELLGIPEQDWAMLSDPPPDTPMSADDMLETLDGYIETGEVTWWGVAA